MARRQLSLGLGRDNSRIFLAMFFNEAAFGIYMTLWPLYIAARGATAPQIGLVMALVGIGRLLALLPSGIIADRVPPRRLIVIARLLTVTGMVMIAAAQAWWHLIPAGMILAVGNIAFPAISSVIAERSGSNRERMRAFTLIYTVGPSIALLLTPAIGGLVAEQFSMRASFLLAAFLAAVAVAFFMMITPSSVTTQEGPPVTYHSTLAQRPIFLICMLQMATIFTLTLGVTLVPNFLQDVHGISIASIGWLASIAAAGSIALGIMISRISALQRPLAAIALAVASVGAGMATLIMGSSLWFFGFAFILRGGYFVAWSLFAAALGEVADDRHRARGFALAEMMGGIGFSVAPFVAGWMYYADPTMPLYAGLLLVIPLILAITWTARTMSRDEIPPAPILVKEGV